ncbi:MAG: hypothetical protein U0228_13030 [Myxococcaceae bacterium]
MRWLLAVVARLIGVALGLASLWYGAQLSGIGASFFDAHRDPRIPPPFHATPLSTSKLDASLNETAPGIARIPGARRRLSAERFFRPA